MHSRHEKGVVEVAKLWTKELLRFLGRIDTSAVQQFGHYGRGLETLAQRASVFGVSIGAEVGVVCGFWFPFVGHLCLFFIFYRNKTDFAGQSKHHKVSILA